MYGNFSVDIEIDPKDDTHAIIKVQMVKDTWFGIGFGKGMGAGTDMIQIDGGANKAYDMVSIGYKAPIKDSVDHLKDVTFTSGAGNLLNVEMRRLLDTQDNRDYVLQAEKDFDLGWALNESTSSIGSYHSKRG